MTGSEGLLTSYAAERRMLEGCMYTTKQRRCILSAYTLKELQTQAWGDASRIIKGWPTSAESLYDAFSKTSAKSCAHLLHRAYFWHSLVAAEMVFYLPPMELQYGSCYTVVSLQGANSISSPKSAAASHLKRNFSASILTSLSRAAFEVLRQWIVPVADMSP